MNKFQQYGVLYIEQVSSGVGGFVLSIHLRCEAFNIKCTVIETYSCIFFTFTLNFREVNSSWIVVEVDDNVYEITFFPWKYGNDGLQLVFLRENYASLGFRYCTLKKSFNKWMVRTSETIWSNYFKCFKIYISRQMTREFKVSR